MGSFNSIFKFQVLVDQKIENQACFTKSLVNGLLFQKNVCILLYSGQTFFQIMEIFQIPKKHKYYQHKNRLIKQSKIKIRNNKKTNTIVLDQSCCLKNFWCKTLQPRVSMTNLSSALISQKKQNKTKYHRSIIIYKTKNSKCPWQHILFCQIKSTMMLKKLC